MALQNTYDQCADEYVRWTRTRHEANLAGASFSAPFLELIGDVNGLRVLDAGCGEGWLSRALNARGAAVVGIDVATRLIEAARTADPDGAIDFQTRDLSHPLPEFESRFDLVVSYMVLNDVPDHLGFIATIGAVTKPRGRAVLAVNNPYSAVIRGKVDSYFDSGTASVYQGLSSHGVRVYYYHRTMEQYVNAFRDQGFVLRTLHDIPPSEDMPVDAARATTWRQGPHVMVLEFIKT